MSLARLLGHASEAKRAADLVDLNLIKACRCEPAADVVAHPEHLRGMGKVDAVTGGDRCNAGGALLGASMPTVEADVLGYDREPFVIALAEHWDEVKVVHAFREGNTRSQRVFFGQLCQNAGYELDTSYLEAHYAEFNRTRESAMVTARSDQFAEFLSHAVYRSEGPGGERAGQSQNPPPTSGLSKPEQVQASMRAGSPTRAIAELGGESRTERGAK